MLVAVAVVALAAGSSRPAPTTLAARTRVIASEVRCPVCQGESAEQSQVPAALTIRTQISQELAAGIAPAKVIADLEQSYGATILERPPTNGISLVVWILPVVVAVAAVVGLILAFVRWGRRPGLPGGGGAGPGSGDAGDPGRPAGSPAGGARPADEDLVARALVAARASRSAAGSEGDPGSSGGS